jgi:hypothetical protein
LIYIILTIIILILLIFLVSVLVVPFHLSLDLHFKDLKTQGNIDLTWMKIRFFRRKIPEEPSKKEKEAQKKEKEKKEEKPFDVNRFFKIFGLFLDSLPYLKRLLEAFWRSINLEELSLNLQLGFYSPAFTALANGYIWSLAAWMNLIPNVFLSAQPDFKNQRLDGSVFIKMNIRLFWIVVEIIRAYTKKPVRSLVNEIRN